VRWVIVHVAAVTPIHAAHIWWIAAPRDVPTAEPIGKQASIGVPYDYPQGNIGADGRRGRRKSMDDEDQAEFPDLLADHRLLEQELTAMSHLLSQHDFASIEEACASSTWQIVPARTLFPPLGTTAYGHDPTS
jgi:hypothetical protein